MLKFMPAYIIGLGLSMSDSFIKINFQVLHHVFVKGDGRFKNVSFVRMRSKVLIFTFDLAGP